MKKKILRLLLLLCGIAIVAAAFAAFALFSPNTAIGNEVKVTIPHEATYEQMKDTLRAHNVLRNEKTFDYTAQLMRFKTIRPCLPAMLETWVQSLGREDPLEKEKATHSSILAWKNPMDRGA